MIKLILSSLFLGLSVHAQTFIKCESDITIYNDNKVIASVLFNHIRNGNEVVIEVRGLDDSLLLNLRGSRLTFWDRNEVGAIYVSQSISQIKDGLEKEIENGSVSGSVGADKKTSGLLKIGLDNKVSIFNLQCSRLVKTSNSRMTSSTTSTLAGSWKVKSSQCKNIKGEYACPEVTSLDVSAVEKGDNKSICVDWHLLGTVESECLSSHRGSINIQDGEMSWHVYESDIWGDTEIGWSLVSKDAKTATVKIKNLYSEISLINGRHILKRSDYQTYEVER